MSDPNTTISVHLIRQSWPWKTFWIVSLLIPAVAGGGGYLCGMILQNQLRGLAPGFPNACAFTAALFSLPLALFLGKRNAGKKWYAGPIADFTEAIRTDPSDAHAYYSRATTYTMKGEHRKAIADWDEVIRLLPNHPDAYVNRVNAHGALFRLKKVIAEYTEIIEHDPNNALAYCARATACNGCGQFDRSIPDATEAIRLDPQLYLGYDARGFGYLQRGNRTGNRSDYEQSIADFTAALQLKPTATDCHYGRAMADLGLKRARK